MLQNKDKKIIGVIGSSGSGKTVFCKIAEKYGAFVIHADQLAHNVIKRKARKEILAEFGTTNRKELGKIVFHDSNKLNALIKITYKYIENSIEEAINLCDNGMIVIDAAELHRSSKLHDLCTKVVAVISKKETQIKRLTLRDKKTTADITARLNNQQSNEFYTKFADVTIENNSTLAEFKEQSRRFWQNETI